MEFFIFFAWTKPTWPIVHCTVKKNSYRFWMSIESEVVLVYIFTLRVKLTTKTENMVIACSTCQKKENEGIWVRYMIYAVLLQFQFWCNLWIFFGTILIPRFLEFTKKVIPGLFTASFHTTCLSRLSLNSYFP